MHCSAAVGVVRRTCGGLTDEGLRGGVAFPVQTGAAGPSVKHRCWCGCGCFAGQHGLMIVHDACHPPSRGATYGPPRAMCPRGAVGEVGGSAGQPPGSGGRVLLNDSASLGEGGRSDPPPLQNFLRVFGQSKIFSGAFGPSQFRPKNFFGAFGASNNSGSPEGGGGGVPPTAPPTHPPPPLWTPPPS